MIDGVELEGLEVFLIHGDARASFVITGSISTGVAIDFEGNVGWFETVGVGAGLMVGASAGGGISVMPWADNLDEVRGWGTSTVVSGAFMGKIGFSMDWALDVDDMSLDGNTNGGVTGTIGAGFEIQIGQEATYTWIQSTTWTDIFDKIVEETNGVVEKLIEYRKGFDDTLKTLESSKLFYNNRINEAKVKQNNTTDKTVKDRCAKEIKKSENKISTLKKNIKSVQSTIDKIDNKIKETNNHD